MVTSPKTRPLTLGWQTWSVMVVVLAFVVGAAVWILTF